MIDARFVFLERPAKLPMQRSRFEATYAQTLKQLERELRFLDARQVTIQAGFRSVRNDGWPYSSAKPEHPACALQFQSKGQPLIFKASRFSSFESNLRSITLTLEALRAVDRYGVVEGEQYAGFKQIAAPGGSVNDGTMNKHAAAQVLAGLCDWTVDQVLADIQTAFKAASRTAHPDFGGTTEAMAAVNQARKVLGNA